MPRTRTVITLLLGAATAAALVLGAAVGLGGVAAADEPTINRGWVTPAGEEFER